MPYLSLKLASLSLKLDKCLKSAHLSLKFAHFNLKPIFFYAPKNVAQLPLKPTYLL